MRIRIASWALIVTFMITGTARAQNGNGGGNGVQQQIAALQNQLAAAQAAIAQLQAALAAETSARQAADNQLQNNINGEVAARKQGDVDTLVAAKMYTDAAVASETAARKQGDADTLAAANMYTDAAINNIDIPAPTVVPQSLLDLAPYVSVVQTTLQGLVGPHVIFNGVNVHIQNGAGSSYDFATGLGNLVIGYNAQRAGKLANRSGSHNLVIGDGHEYRSVGGFVGGYSNTISGSGGAVLSGIDNVSSGLLAAVSGGDSNVASGSGSTVSGGEFNNASGNWSNVSGGQSRSAAGATSWAAGALSQPN